MTEAEKEFIEKATSSEYAKYLLEQKLIENTKGVITKYKWWIGITLSLMLTIIAVVGYRQIKLSNYYKTQTASVKKLSESLENELDSLRRLKANIELSNESYFLSLERKKGELDQDIVKLQTKREEFDATNGLSNQYNAAFKSNLTDIRVNRSEMRDDLDESKELLKSIQEVNERSLSILQTLNKETLVKRLEELSEAIENTKKLVPLVSTLYLGKKSQSKVDFEFFGQIDKKTIELTDLEDDSITLSIGGQQNRLFLNEPIGIPEYDGFIFVYRAKMKRTGKNNDYLIILDIIKS